MCHKLLFLFKTRGWACVQEGARGRRGCDHVVVGFITTYVISAYHH